MKIIAISDVHERWKDLVIPECDVLISAGDYSFHGEPWVVKHFHEWLDKQPATHIISVQGNHEVAVEKDFEMSKQLALQACPRVHFIEEGEVIIDGVKFYGSAITPFFHDWAYNRMPGSEIQIHWDKIPGDTNVVITHGPVFGILDMTYYTDGSPKQHVGCLSLLNRIKEIKPDLHVCGHIHSGHGQHHEDGTSFYNVAICDERYMPTNPVTVIDYLKE